MKFSSIFIGANVFYCITQLHTVSGAELLTEHIRLEVCCLEYVYLYIMSSA